MLIVLAWTLAVTSAWAPAWGQTPAWTYHFDSIGYSEYIYTPRALAVDAAGNAYVSALTVVGSIDTDFLTVKLDPSGTPLWLATYDSGAQDDDGGGYGLTIDGVGNVYATGFSSLGGASQDAATIKYNTTGTLMWANRLTHGGTFTHYPQGVAVDAGGTVYTTGYYFSAGVQSNVFLHKITSAGITDWTRDYNGPANLGDWCYDIRLDSSGNPCIAATATVSGTGNFDYTTIKYSTAGTQLWLATYSGAAGQADHANGMAIDASDNVYVTGRSTGSGTNFDCATVKYSPSGTQLWAHRFTGPGNRSDEGKHVVTDAVGNVYVTGSAQVNGDQRDALTLKYNSSGTLLWSASYGLSQQAETGNSVAVEGDGSVYITGFRGNFGNDDDLLTLKYSSSGSLLWARIYNGHSNRRDSGEAVVIAPGGGVVMAGYTEEEGEYSDLTVIKYVQCGGPDCNGNALADECETFYGTTEDCNSNLSPDACDWVNPANVDCNSNGVLDGCEPDCNTNGHPDDCDVDLGTSTDCTGNGIADDCEPDCDSDGAADACEIFFGTSEDCNTNQAPDECDIMNWVSQDCNGNVIPDECELDCNSNGTADECEIMWGWGPDCNLNGVPDECEPDCNTNFVPDACDIGGVTSLDCDSNGVPDECDVASEDCNLSGIPDDCELVANDCNANAVPDECDLAINDCNADTVPDDCQLTDNDCNTDLTPDDCQLAGNDCDVNSIPDDCDLADDPDADFDGNGVHDACEGAFWIGPNGGSIFDAPNWSPTGVPGGRAILRNASSDDNRAVMSSGAEWILGFLGIDGNGAGRQILQISEGDICRPEDGLRLAGNAAVILLGGTINGGPIDNAGQSLGGYGRISTDIQNAAELAGSPGETLRLTGASLTNGPAGLIRSPIGSAVLVDVPSVSQAGEIEIRTGSIMVFDVPLTNETNGIVRLLGGSFGGPSFTNDPGAVIHGFGTIDCNILSYGNLVTIADTQIVGNLHNEGTVIIQSGLLTVTGNVSGSGAIIGGFGGRDGDPTGLVIHGDLDLSATDTSLIDFSACTLQFDGGHGRVQTCEVMSPDIGPIGGRNLGVHAFAIDTLRIGQSATTVQLLDRHDNKGASSRARRTREALYIRHLILEPGVTLDLAGLRLYYESVSPGEPLAPNSGVSIVDSVGGGELVRINTRQGR